MAHKPITALPELVSADYNIYDFTNGIYKIVRFKSNAPRLGPGPREKQSSYENKLDASLSRARRSVLELALCNDWDYFCTFTISKDKFDRSNLVKWRDSFTQWMRDYRKKGFEIAYVLVPERHADGSWHAHGLMKGNIPLISFVEERKQGMFVPDKLVYGDYLDWPDYRKKFGFCSFGKIKDPVATGFYVTKYLTKDQSSMVSDVGLHLYYCSKGLNRAEFHGDIYGYCAALDTFLTNHYDFCDTGMTHVKDNLDWSFGLEYMAMESLEFDKPAAVDQTAVDDYMEAVQSVLEGFGYPEAVPI